MLHHLHLCLLLGTTASAWTHPSVPAATETSAPKWAHGAGDTKDAASFTSKGWKNKPNASPRQASTSFTSCPGKTGAAVAEDRELTMGWGNICTREVRGD